MHNPSPTSLLSPSNSTPTSSPNLLITLPYFITLLLVIATHPSLFFLRLQFSHMRSQQLDLQTFRKLKAERVKEILREGALVTFRNARYPLPQHFDFDLSNENRVIELLTASKFSVQLCDAEGDELFRFKPSELYLPKPPQKGRIYVSSDRHLSRFGVRSGCSYYLARVNPTINAYKGLYSVDNNQYQMQEFTESQHIIKYFRGETNRVVIDANREIGFQYQKDFNARQNQAISKCGRNGLTFIKGPPGCGKTRTIARLCKLFLTNNLKVIVGAVSNTGNLSIIRQLVTQLSQYNNTKPLEKYYHQYFQTNPAGYYQLLSGFYEQHIKINLVFYPHFQMKEEDLPPVVRLYSYDTQVIKNMIKVSNGINTPYLIQQYRKLKEKETVDKKFYAVFMQAVNITTYQAKIIVATTVRAKSINARLQQSYMFQPDVAILDQASQSSCSDTLCYLKLNVERLILVGDEKQLNPTVISNDKLLKQSFFNKFSQNKQEYFTMLDVQYRMHPNISILSNQFFYHFAIKDGVAAGNRVSYITPFCNHPVLFINCPHDERQEIDETSKKFYVNYHEVYIIKTYLQFFPQQQLTNVGIITPYMEQLKLLQKELWKEVKEGLTIKTCDGFQGGQKDYIFIALVRSNQQGNIGFCSQESRINVSITRARRGMMIVGNYLTFSKSLNYWGLIINHIHTAFSAYFDFTLQIPQAEIDRLMAVHRTEEVPNKMKAFQQPPQQSYLSYEDYVNEFFKDIPDASEAVLQAYYLDYVSQVQNWLYEQQYEQSAVKQELEVKASKAPLCLETLREDLNKEDSEDEDEVERLIRKNKVEAKLLRRLDFLRVGGTAEKTVEAYVTEIQAIFQQVPLDYREISRRMTKQCRKQSLSYLQKSTVSPLDTLRELITKISHKDYTQNHIKGSENVYLMIQWMLMKKLNDSL